MTVITANGHRDKAYCGANKRQGEGTCRRPAGWGTSHVGIGACKLHGGSTPGATKGAERVAQRAAVERAVVFYGLPREVDPWMALLEEVHRTAGHVEWLGGQVASVEATEDDAAAAGPWMEHYQAERAHLVRVAKAAMECGVAERQVRLAEAQGAAIVGVLRGVLGELGVLDDPRVADVVQRHLTAVIETQAIEA